MENLLPWRKKKAFAIERPRFRLKFSRKILNVRCDHVKPGQLADVKGLDLSRKSMDALKPGDFNNLTGLKVLHVNDNDLRSLPLGIFDDLTSLDTLGLADNKLSHLPPDVSTTWKP